MAIADSLTYLKKLFKELEWPTFDPDYKKKQETLYSERNNTRLAACNFKLQADDSSKDNDDNDQNGLKFKENKIKLLIIFVPLKTRRKKTDSS
jgi:hypothetical protein